MPRGTDYKIPLADALRAAEQHRLGFSLRAIARMNWRRWGYASPKSATMALGGALRALDLPVRDRIDATVLACTVHGNSTRAARDPAHPDHAAHLAQRRHARAQRRQATP